jgi:hypothetical protein
MTVRLRALSRTVTEPRLTWVTRSRARAVERRATAQAAKLEPKSASSTKGFGRRTSSERARSVDGVTGGDLPDRGAS